MNLFKCRPAAARMTDREHVMAERRAAAVMFADHILTHTRDWGVNPPEECMALATGLLNTRWLVREGRLSEWERRP